MKIIEDFPLDTTVDYEEEGNRLISEEKTWSESLIELLKQNKYEYCEVSTEEELKANLRRQVERLNPSLSLSDAEWERFYSEQFEGDQNSGQTNRNRKIQVGAGIFDFTRDDSSLCQITVLDKKDLSNNHLQISETLKGHASGNVTILVNGLPLVQVQIVDNPELEEGFEQVNSPNNPALKGLLEYIQIFVISNGISTKYYSNTAKGSFPLSSYWGYARNNPAIRSLTHFANTFLQPHTILEVLTKYCVLSTDGRLNVLRPFQIAAIEKIMGRLKDSVERKLTGKEAGGYVWHSSEQEKNLTSFKAAQLALEVPEVTKVIFIVDKKDIGLTTCGEYKKYVGEYQKPSVLLSTGTPELLEYLNNMDKSIIITTIQQLRRALKDESQIGERIRNGRVVIFVNECHENYTVQTYELIKKFQNRCFFGFTATPMIKRDKSMQVVNQTTETFGELLHEYKYSDAINDGHALKLHIKYFASEYEVEGGDESVDHPSRVANIVDHVIHYYDENTNQRQFNSMMIIRSIPMIINYYKEFKKQSQYVPEEERLKVVMIYSQYTFGENAEERERRYSVEDKQEALFDAMSDFNAMFGTDVQDFTEYRRCVTEKVKNREIDVLLVVDMFTAGLVAPMLNTVWIDRPLEGYKLIQTMSRTTFVYDKTKPFGNIACFRKLDKEVEDALALFVLGKVIEKDGDVSEGIQQLLVN